MMTPAALRLKAKGWGKSAMVFLSLRRLYFIIFLFLTRAGCGCGGGGVVIVGDDADESGRPDSSSDGDLVDPDFTLHDADIPLQDYLETEDGTPADECETDDGSGEEAAVSGCVGDPCSSASQCGCVPGSERECLLVFNGNIVFPAGYCSAVCTSSEECGAGAECVELITGQFRCLKRCSSTFECRIGEGYFCAIIVDIDPSYCLPTCCDQSDDS